MDNPYARPYQFAWFFAGRRTDMDNEVAGLYETYEEALAHVPAKGTLYELDRGPQGSWRPYLDERGQMVSNGRD